MTQIEYIDILFDDLGYTLEGRRVFLHIYYFVKYSDELTISQRSALIDELKQQKEDKKQ